MGAAERFARLDEDARELKDQAAAAAARCDEQAKARAEIRRQRGLEAFVAPPVPEEERRAATACREWREAQTRAHRAQLFRDVKAAAKSGEGGCDGDDGRDVGGAAGSGRDTAGGGGGGASGGTYGGRGTSGMGGAGGSADYVSRSTGWVVQTAGVATAKAAAVVAAAAGTTATAGAVAIGTTDLGALWDRRPTRGAQL